MLVYSSHTRHVAGISGSLYCLCKKYTPMPPLNKYPKSVKSHQNPLPWLIARGKRLRFSRITSGNGNAVISKYFFIDIYKISQSFAQICNGNAPTISLSFSVCLSLTALFNLCLKLVNARANELCVRWSLPSRRALKSFISQREQIG